MTEVLPFGENTDSMNFQEGLAYVARHRRKMERFERIIPPGASFDRAELEAIRSGLEDIERRIRAHPDCPANLR
jgi:hypothetical protein